MYKENLFACPICGLKLEYPVKQDPQDNLIIRCKLCGKYTISLAYYEDFLDPSRLKSIDEMIEEFLRMI